jgi:hypothetical protein
MFRVAVLARNPDGGTRYLASTDSPHGRCQFELVIEPTKPSSAQFSFTKAALMRRPASDCTAFLAALAPQLDFHGELPAPPRAKSLSLAMAILGTKQSRTPGTGEIAGGFTSTPPGNWTAGKLFFKDGEGEVFLHVNEQDGLGEFSIKDSDYATVVVTELAKVLLPDPA